MAVFMTAWFFYGSLWILRSLILVNCAGKPEFKSKVKDIYVANVGRSVRLRCPVSGTDGPKINRTLVAWFKGRSVIHNTDPRWIRFLLKDKKHLKIVNVHKEDAGTYTCKAMNGHGSTELNIVLRVKAKKKTERGKPPEFKKFPKTRKMYKTGETAKLHCHSTGNPDPNVGWFKDGKSYGVDKRTSVGEDGWSLNLRYLTVADSGNYTCRVSNNVGSINRTFRVVVKARTLKPIIDKPEVVERAINEGRAIKLYCKVFSFGHVTFRWRWLARNSSKSVDLKFGSKYIGNYTKTAVVSLNQYYFEGFLVIKDVRKQDEGRYSCMVEDSHGKDELDFYLRVKGKEDLDRTQTTTPNPTVTVAAETKSHEEKDYPTEEKIPITLVAVLTAAIIAILIFIVIFILCCWKQRKDLEKQYLSEYQPQNVYQPFSRQISVAQEMQKSEKDDSVLKINGDENEPINTCAPLHSSQNSLGDSKRAPSSSSEMYLANSRTSLQTTLCRTCPRETSFDYNGSTSHSLPRRTECVQSDMSRGLPFSASTLDSHDDERQNWESKTSLDDSPRNTSPQRSRESIV